MNSVGEFQLQSSAEAAARGFSFIGWAVRTKDGSYVKRIRLGDGAFHREMTNDESDALVWMESRGPQRTASVIEGCVVEVWDLGPQRLVCASDDEL